MSNITPPPELVQQWFDIWQGSDDDDVAFADFVAVRASQYGADQELEACCAWLDSYHAIGHSPVVAQLRAARRPKPPSLKEQALEVLDDAKLDAAHYNIILRALEALPDE